MCIVVFVCTTLASGGDDFFKRRPKAMATQAVGVSVNMFTCPDPRIN